MTCSQLNWGNIWPCLLCQRWNPIRQRSSFYMLTVTVFLPFLLFCGIRDYGMEQQSVISMYSSIIIFVSCVEWLYNAMSTEHSTHSTLSCVFILHLQFSVFSQVVAIPCLSPFVYFSGTSLGSLLLFTAGTACIVLWQVFDFQRLHRIMANGEIHCVLYFGWQYIIVDIYRFDSFLITFMINFSRSGQMLSSVRQFCLTSGCIW